MVQTQRTTLEDFERYIAQPGNENRLFEYIEGEIVEVVTNSYSSEVAANILIQVGAYVQKRKLGRITGEAGGYQVGQYRYLPDVGFISKARQPEPSHETFNPNAPDLAVEVLSPTDRPKIVRAKIINYLNAGTVVWLVDPVEKEVEVYVPGRDIQTLRLDDTLDGGDVLPGFRLAVQAIFPG